MRVALRCLAELRRSSGGRLQKALFRLSALPRAAARIACGGTGKGRGDERAAQKECAATIFIFRAFLLRKSLTIISRVCYHKHMKHFLRQNGMYAIYAYYYCNGNAPFCHA